MSVYFVQAGEAIKIGYSKDPKKRIADLQVASPQKLAVLRIEDGDIGREKDLHRRFSDLHIHGEWFRYEGELRSYLTPLREPEVSGLYPEGASVLDLREGTRDHRIEFLFRWLAPDCDDETLIEGASHFWEWGAPDYLAIWRDENRDWHMEWTYIPCADFGDDDDDSEIENPFAPAFFQHEAILDTWWWFDNEAPDVHIRISMLGEDGLRHVPMDYLAHRPILRKNGIALIPEQTKYRWITGDQAHWLPTETPG